MPIFISSSEFVMTPLGAGTACAIDVKFGRSQSGGCVAAHTIVDPQLVAQHW
jgi:hypothetical protein